MSMYSAREQAADRFNHSPEAEAYRKEHGHPACPCQQAARWSEAERVRAWADYREDSAMRAENHPHVYSDGSTARAHVIRTRIEDAGMPWQAR